MSHFKVEERDLFFILKEQLGYGSLCSLERYRELDEETLDLTLTEAIRFARGVVAPLQEIGERWGTPFEKGRVRCAPEFREALRLYGENGWVGASRDPAWGGSGLPHMMRYVINDLMYGACQAFNSCPSLTHGAGHLIETFGTEDLKRRFVPPMYAARWTGTMCLTEPQAGSNLAAVRALATPEPEGGAYRIRGTKIFISWGEHDLAENIVHLVLARTPGAPEGVKGISLFVVPKFRVEADGRPGAPNDVVCTGVERKLGLHASPTCTLAFGGEDGCVGYLCGTENRGLAHMFQMMNSARINSGVSGMALASSAYRNALEYARTRVQGADLAGRKKGSVPIADHPDVRRMLLWMKATVDGLRSLIYSAAYWHDLARELPEGPERTHRRHLTEFLTPIVKAYASDQGFRVCETAMQCLGGYGFCEDYPIEQYLRDAKVLSLYEGTNGIQALDLLGRKMEQDGGAPYRAWLAEVEGFCAAHAGDEALGGAVGQLARAVGRLKEVAEALARRRRSEPLRWGCSTYPALVSFGDLTVTWRLLDLGLAAARALREGRGSAYHRGKVLQASYFATATLPPALGRLESCLAEQGEPVEMPEEAF
jgi:alkylation response protein AidB-like acyl-CoA dehydrogenase